MNSFRSLSKSMKFAAIALVALCVCVFSVDVVGFTALAKQALSRTTPIAGGPPQGPNGGFVGDFDSGITTLTNSLTALTTQQVLVTNIFCANTTAGAVTVTITNTAGTAYVQAFSMAANSTAQFLNGGKGVIMAGIKWNAGANASVNCQIAGYQ